MYKYPNGALVVMAKSPEPGRVKTRLQTHFSSQQACDIYRELALFSIEQWRHAALCPIYYFYSGDKTIFANAFNVDSSSMWPQEGGDLGARMSSAVEHVSHSDFVILVGTDCPFVDKAYLQQAIDALSKAPVVIGPATDGGYVLLAMRTHCQALFGGIDWGSDRVLSQTLEHLRAENLDVHLLETLNDIDYPEDLHTLKSLPLLMKRLNCIF